MLFGRSKSRQRSKFPDGISKLKIGNPTPINAININGGFIDLAVNPQNGAGVGGESALMSPRPPIVPPLPSQQQAPTRPKYPAPNPEPRRAVSDSARDEERLVQGARSKPGLGAPSPRQLGIPPPNASALPGSNDGGGRSSSSARAPKYPAPSPYPKSSPYSPTPCSPSSPFQAYQRKPEEPRSTTPSSGRNFSRKLSNTPDEFATESEVSVVSAASSQPIKIFDARRPDLDLEGPAVRSTEASTPRSPIVPELQNPPTRGRRRERTDSQPASPQNISQISLQKSDFTYDDSEDRVTSFTQSPDWEQLREVASGRNTPQSLLGRATPQSESRDTLPLRRAPSRSSSVYSGELPREDAPRQLHITQTKDSEISAVSAVSTISAASRPKTPSETLRSTSNNGPSFGVTNQDIDPVSPLLPSPPARNEYRPYQVQEDSPTVGRKSPAFFDRPAPQHLPALDIARPADDELYRLFSTDSEIQRMPSRVREPVISGPTSPIQGKLPTYLGPLQDVQTSTPITPNTPVTPVTPATPITPINAVERLQPKLGIGRKVSTRLRGLIGSRQRPPYDRNNPSPENQPVRSRLGQIAISEPVPIPEEDREVDPEIERLKMRFDMEAKQSESNRLEVERALAEAEEEEQRLERQLAQIKKADQERTARRRMEAESSAAQRREAERMEREQVYAEPRVAYSKVDRWNYNPSASTSKSSLSEVMSSSEGPSVVSDPGLSSRQSSVSRSGGRDAASPITPADELSFLTLRGGETTKSNSTMRTAGPSTVGKRSVEVPVFLSLDNEDVPAFSQHPPTPRATETQFERNSFCSSEVEHQLEGRLAKDVRKLESRLAREANGETEDYLRPSNTRNCERSDSGSSSTHSFSGNGLMSALSSPTSTAPTSALPSPLPPPIPTSIKPTAKPPFAGGPKLLRSATMSSRPGGNKPLKSAVKAVMAANTISESAPSSPLTPRHPAPRPPPRGNPNDQSCEGGFHAPPQRQIRTPTPTQSRAPSPAEEARQLYDDASSHSRRHGPAAFSFAPSSIYPDDSISNVGSRNTYLPTPGPMSAPLELDRSLLPPPPPTPKHVPSETDWQPQLRGAKSFADLPKNNRVAALSGNLRVDTSVGPSTASSELSVPEPDVGRSNTVKRAKSYGGGLRRAFSRRAPNPERVPSPPPVASPVVELAPQRIPSLPTSPSEGPEDGKKAQSGTLVIGEKHLRPRKGSLTTGKCTYCDKGPFANMWVCLDERAFVVCRMCCNEMVTEQRAALF